MSYSESVGKKMKELREQKGLSIAQLAENCKLSEEVIADIENAKNVPNIAVLAEMARGLNVRPETFVDDGEGCGPVLTRNGEGTVSTNYANGHVSHPVFASYCDLAAGKPGSHMEPFVLTLKASDGEEAPMSKHEGEEMIYVLDGEVEVVYGKNTYSLKKGDSLYYDSVIPHSVTTKSAAKVLAVIYTPIN